jgi:hypothetical protein
MDGLDNGPAMTREHVSMLLRANAMALGESGRCNEGGFPWCRDKCREMDKLRLLMNSAAAFASASQSFGKAAE